MAKRGIKFFKQQGDLFGKPAAPKKAPPAPPEPHLCECCGHPASFGYGVRLLKGEPGRWFCGICREQYEHERNVA